MTATRIPPSTDGHRTRDEMLLAADITDAEMVKRGYHTGHLDHERWVVGVSHVKPQHGRPSVVTVFSPCCGQRRQRIMHGYAFSCPACGWWWRYHCLGYDNRFVSLGRERPT